MRNRSAKRKGSRATHDRARQAEWRARVPEARRIVEDMSPRLFEAAEERRLASLPEAWTRLVESMQQKVHADADKAARESSDDLPIEQRRGYYWGCQLLHVADMMEFLLRKVREDIGLHDATLASMALARHALLSVQIELQDGGSKDGRDDGEEQQYRVRNALRALVRHFDDVHLRRFRAVAVAEFASKTIHIPGDEEVEARLRDSQGPGSLPDEEVARHREHMRVDGPVVNGVFVRSLLSEVDERFGSLDPLVVLEEFSEAEAKTRGGRTDGGEGRTGPVRALAGLAVRCGALDYGAHDGESFDDAVERARSNLLVTRSRIRKSMREFPSLPPSDAEGE